jgi:hypothetical protein
VKAFIARFLVGAAVISLVAGIVTANFMIFGLLLVVAVVMAAFWLAGDAIIALVGHYWRRYQRRRKGWSG